jgi:hypothetical protein
MYDYNNVLPDLCLPPLPAMPSPPQCVHSRRRSAARSIRIRQYSLCPKRMLCKVQTPFGIGIRVTTVKRVVRVPTLHPGSSCLTLSTLPSVAASNKSLMSLKNKREVMFQFGKFWKD